MSSINQYQNSNQSINRSIILEYQFLTIYYKNK